MYSQRALSLYFIIVGFVASIITSARITVNYST